MTTQNLVLNIEGMNCGNCAQKVKSALTKIAGVSSADVDLAAKSARVVFDPDATNAAALMYAVKSVGFKPTGFAAA